MQRKMLRLAVAAVAVLVGCRSEPPAGQAEQGGPPTPADTVAEAIREYDPALFDTVKWASDSLALARGADVFNWACSTCHGKEGRGDGGYVLNGDTLHPPSFLEPDWRFAQDSMGLRRRIFIGNGRGMPHWGLRHMEPRDIVAVQRFILYELRSPARLHAFRAR